MPAAAVIPFPPTYRIGYSDGDQCGLVEDADGLTLCFRQQWKAEQARVCFQLGEDGADLFFGHV
jgi:hypothetical protein